MAGLCGLAMIRRELKLSEGGALWLLVSQVEHAHVSGALVENWHEGFASDVVEAIRHHDDGWAEWESEPRMNPEIGAPYSFLEMPIAESTTIWDGSIAAARKFGPLAGWIVCGHFYNLLADSEHGNEPPAIAWLTAKRKVRTTWLDEWIRRPVEQSGIRQAAQQMLPLADLFSLWLCCDCPVEAPSPCPLPRLEDSPVGEGSDSGLLGRSTMKLRTDSLLARFRFVAPECTIRESVSKKRVEGLSWIVPVAPYPFKISPLTVSVQATAAPASRYGTWPELAAAGWPVELTWRLVPTVQDGTSTD